MLMILCIWFRNCWWQPGPKNKRWSVLSLRRLSPADEPSRCYFHDGDGVCEEFEQKTSIKDCGVYTPQGFLDQWASNATVSHQDQQCPGWVIIGQPAASQVSAQPCLTFPADIPDRCSAPQGCPSQRQCCWTWPLDYTSAVHLLSCVQLFATPWTTALQASLTVPVSHSLFKFISTGSVIPSNHLILCCPLFLLPSIFPSTRVFSNESAHCIRWPKYWSFSISLFPVNIQGWFPLGVTDLVSWKALTNLDGVR